MHILIIGGTGMLSGVAIQLASDGHDVSVIGRTKSKFKVIQQKVEKPMFPLLVDYRTEKVYELIENAIAERGPFDMIINWCPDYRILERVSRMNGNAASFNVIHVKGSRRFFEDEAVNMEGNFSYHEVFLGFHLGPEGSRWLTHEEICQGVLSAMISDGRSYVIGQIEPYEARPNNK